MLFLAFALCFLMVVFFKQDMRIRWISPIVPSLILLSAAGLYRMSQWLGETWPHLQQNGDALVLGLATICILTTTIPYMRVYFKKVAPMEYLCGRISREDYIAHYRPEYTVIQYANQHLDPPAKILGIFIGNRGYYFENPVRFSSRFTEKYIIPNQNIEGIEKTIQEKDFRYILVNYAMLNRQINESLSSDQKKMVLSFFTKELKLVFKDNGYGLYEVN